MPCWAENELSWLGHGSDEHLQGIICKQQRQNMRPQEMLMMDAFSQPGGKRVSHGKFWGLGSTDFYVLPAWNRTPKIPFSSKDPCNPRKDLPRVKDSPGGPQATMAWPPPAFQQHLPVSRENTFLRIPLLRKFAYFHALVRSGLSEMCFPPGYHDLCLIIGQGDD